MLRRISCVVGLALLMAMLVAVPARGAVCPELDPLAREGNLKQVGGNMDGGQVVDGGDSDGEGTVVLTFVDQDNKDAEVAYQVDTAGVATPIGADIHQGSVGETGRSVVILFQNEPDPSRSGTVMMSKCLAHDIFNQPEDFYVDVHNEDFERGAIRGQLSTSGG